MALTRKDERNRGTHEAEERRRRGAEVGHDFMFCGGTGRRVSDEPEEPRREASRTKARWQSPRAVEKSERAQPHVGQPRTLRARRNAAPASSFGFAALPDCCFPFA